jgi:GLPGLI family protein
MIKFKILTYLLTISSLVLGQEKFKTTVYIYNFWCRENPTDEYKLTSMALASNGDSKYFLPTDFMSKVSNEEKKIYSKFSTTTSGSPKLSTKGTKPFSNHFVLKNKKTSEVYELLDLKINEDPEDKFYSIINEKISWEIDDTIIHSEKYKIPVQRAHTNYKGRRYRAYFAPGIPVNLGPYKFDGLPGLIVILNDLESNYIYKLESINSDYFESTIHAIPQILKDFELLQSKEFIDKKKEVIKRHYAFVLGVSKLQTSISNDGGVTYAPFKYKVNKLSDLMMEIED